MEACDSCLSELLLSPSKSLQQYDIRPCQFNLLWIWNFHRPIVCILEPCSLLPCNPASSTQSRPWSLTGCEADKMHANRDTDPREIPEISDSITFLLGQDPTCADGPFLPSAAGVKMHSCTRRTDEKSPHAPTAAMPSRSRICICTIGQAASHGALFF